MQRCTLWAKDFKDWFAVIDWNLVGPVALALVPVAGLAWGIRSWLYGGSVVRVEFNLGVLDQYESLLNAPVHTWNDGRDSSSLLNARLNKFGIDVAHVLVINKGRTATTITSVGLHLGRIRHHDFFIGGVLLEPGETDTRVRIEAHDSRLFVFQVWPLVSHGHAERARLLGPANQAADVRAQVTTGVGKVVRSSRRVVVGRHLRSAIWKPRVGQSTLIGDVSPEVALYREVVTPGKSAQTAQAISAALRKARQGHDEEEISEYLDRTFGFHESTYFIAAGMKEIAARETATDEH